MTLSESAIEHKRQLPKPSRFARWRLSFEVFAVLSATAIAVFGYRDQVCQNQTPYAYSAVLGLVIACLVVFIYTREIFAPKRLSEYTIFSHYINHIARDFLVDSEKYDGRLVLQELVDALSQCFTCIVGKKCYVSIKEYDVSLNEVSYFIGDSTYSTKIHPGKHIHVSRYKSIYYLLAGIRSRYFISNDVAFDFNNGEYSHPMLEDGFVPIYRKLSFKYRWFPYNWPLVFRSTIVVPIRYSPYKNDKTKDKYFGFLCVDCVARNVFDERYHPELLAATADILCVLTYRMTELNARQREVTGN